MFSRIKNSKSRDVTTRPGGGCSSASKSITMLSCRKTYSSSSTSCRLCLYVAGSRCYSRVLVAQKTKEWPASYSNSDQEKDLTKRGSNHPSPWTPVFPSQDTPSQVIQTRSYYPNSGKLPIFSRSFEATPEHFHHLFETNVLATKRSPQVLCGLIKRLLRGTIVSRTKYFWVKISSEVYRFWGVPKVLSNMAPRNN